MSEIIWAMNSRFDTTENLTGYLRRYASEFLEEHHIPFEFTAPDAQIEFPMGGEMRRNLFLVFKEILHNALKYSGATKIEVTIRIQPENTYTLTLFEVGGKGFDPIQSHDKGNGLYNARKRMAAIGGQIEFDRSDAGMTTWLSVPIKETIDE
jgi:signal transduction histidine kinase